MLEGRLNAPMADDVDGHLRACVPGASPPRHRAVRRPSRPVPDVPEEVVAAAVAGERAAVGLLLAMIRPLVVNHCRSRLGQGRAQICADDVAQEVCVAVLTALPHYQQRGTPFLAFVFGIAAHKMIDAHRAVARSRAEPVAEPPDAIELGSGPEQRALERELSERLRTVLNQLPETQREILVLRIALGLSAKETAMIVGATPGAVRLAQHRALKLLRRVLQLAE
jgi:RNA polymerase sigma-70 factor, ECF subfamily